MTQLKCLTSRVFWTAYSSQTLHTHTHTTHTSMNIDENAHNEQNGDSKDNATETQNSDLSMECARYLQLLTPCLRLINSMFSSCPKNVRLHYQTLTFFQKHSDIINKLLTLDHCDFVVLKSVKLIVSIWYQLYCGPLYVRHSNRVSSISARDATIIQNIESKIQIFYFLIKKFKDLAFKKRSYLNIDSVNGDFEIMNSEIYNESTNANAQSRGESKETISREILRILINIFRIQSIGSSNKWLESSNNPFETIFEKNLNINNKINDSPPNLRLLCECLLGIIPVSKQTGKWIQIQNTELTQIANNNNVNLLSKLQYIEPMYVIFIYFFCFLK